MRAVSTTFATAVALQQQRRAESKLL